MKRHLIVKLAAIGDIAFAAPAVQAFYEKEGGEIHWVSGEIALPLVRLFPFVHRTYSISDRRLLKGSLTSRLSELANLWKQLAGESYDTCAVLHTDWRYRLPSLPVRAKRQINLKFRKNREQSFIQGRSQPEELRRILLGMKEPIEEKLKPVDLTPYVTVPQRFAKNGARPRVALVPGGAKNMLRDNPQRRWPLENFVAVARQLTSMGYEVVLIGGPGEEELAASFSGIPVLNAIGQVSLPELIGLYTSSDLVISPDTGPLHLARLTRVPVIALYGPQHPDDFFPKGDSATVLWGGEKLPCRPCYDGREFAECPSVLCMRSITVDAVLRATDAVLQRRNSGRTTLITPSLPAQNLQLRSVG
jgi:heptosyltransferase II